MIRQIVNRCHVSDSNLAVIKYLRTRANNWWDVPRQTRREAMRLAIQTHRQNRELYDYVQSGRIKHHAHKA